MAVSQAELAICRGGRMRKILRYVSAACIVSAMLVMTACGSKSVVGRWSGSQNDAVITYEFNEDGTGSMDIGEGIVLPINYTYEDGKLNITYEYLGTNNSTEYSVVIDKKTLTLNSQSSNVTLEKQ